MAAFVFHAVPGSPYARPCYMALAEKGAAFRIRALPPGGNRAAPHLARHPFGRVPTLEHGDFSLYETQAILRYIDRVVPGPALTPADPRAAARMDQLMNINDWYLFQGVNNVIGFQRIVAPRLFGTAPDEAVIAAAMPAAHRVIGELSRLLGAQDYFTGNVSLADLMLAAQLDFLAQTPEWVALATPNLTIWLARMNARPSMQATTWQRTAEVAEAD